MSTSVMVSYLDPNRRNQPFTFTRAACFGTMNRLSGQSTSEMDVMEWHPHSRGTLNANPRQTCTPRKAFNFINSFGMWKDLFHVTTINTIACDQLRTAPIDAVITGFMSMRDYQERYNTLIFSDGALNPKIEFALWCSGIYRNRYNSPMLNINSPDHGEGGVCDLPSSVDALALYLLVYGTKEDFAGCWAQPIIGDNPATREGYVRNSSSDSRRREIRQTRSSWNSLSDWMRTWLETRPEQHQSKLGRLTIRRFYDGLIARLNAEPSANPARQAEIINNAFEELRDMYA